MSVESHPFYRTALDLAEEAANSLTPFWPDEPDNLDYVWPVS